MRKNDLKRATHSQPSDQVHTSEIRESCERHSDVMKHGRGEEAPVPEIQENCVEVVAIVVETRAAEQPGS